MFESRTFEAIREEMLDEISDDVDKREGAIIYDAIAPAALKLAEMYSDLDVFLSLVFADTADGDFLTRRAAEYGIYRHRATSAIRKGEFTDTDGELMEIPIGSRFRVEGVTFRVIEEIAIGEYRLQAEESGTTGNESVGELLPIEPIDDLGIGMLTEVLTPGTNEESDASLYARYQIRVQKQATSGNIYHYEQWALAVPGVGGVKVIPTWDGAGTVKVVILSTEKTPATQDVVEETYHHIEGERPIGALVTVESATGLEVNVTANITLASGYTIEDAENQFHEVLTEYLKSIAFEDELIRYSRIAMSLLDVPAIVDYGDLLVNGDAVNIETEDEEVGIAGLVMFSD